jgi:hypothetical protein
MYLDKDKKQAKETKKCSKKKVKDGSKFIHFFLIRTRDGHVTSPEERKKRVKDNRKKKKYIEFKKRKIC